MHSGYCEEELVRVGAIASIAVMKKTNLLGPMLLFDTSLEEFRVSKRDSILTQAQKIGTRGGTNTALPVQFLRRQKKRVDNLIMITDEQQNALE